MLTGAVLVGIYAPIALYLVSHYKNPFLAYGGNSLFGIFLSMFGGPMVAWMVESFPPEARLSSMSIGYNLAQCVFGGSAPAISTLLVDKVSLIAPGFYVSACAVIGFFGVYMSDVSKEDRQKIDDLRGVSRREGRVESAENDRRGLLKSSDQEGNFVGAGDAKGESLDLELVEIWLAAPGRRKL